MEIEENLHSVSSPDIESRPMGTKVVKRKTKGKEGYKDDCWGLVPLAQRNTCTKQINQT